MSFTDVSPPPPMTQTAIQLVSRLPIRSVANGHSLWVWWPRRSPFSSRWSMWLGGMSPATCLTEVGVLLSQAESGRCEKFCAPGRYDSSAGSYRPVGIREVDYTGTA